MNRITQLGPEIIPKIAAGEVVQSPASVVKELVENSLDAHAKKITLEIEDSGTSLIKVIDDGDGIYEQDIVLAVLPHYTSKIKKFDDLSRIASFGFRGEALPSICAVSDVCIKSRTSDVENGFLFDSENISKNLSKVGMPCGTIVEVKNLFSKHPARKKFLKSALVEYQNILKTLTAFALGNPYVAFEFYKNKELVFKVTQNDDLQTRIAKLLGSEIAKNLLQVAADFEHLTIQGYITKPQISQRSKSNQFLYVNNRSVNDGAISSVVKAAYKTLLDAHSFPPFVLDIKIDPILVDVNVHPQKDQVKFWNEEEVLEDVRIAIENTLKNAELDFVYGDDFYKNKKAALHTFSMLKDSTPVWQVRQNDLPDYSQVFQVDNTYLVYPQGNSLVLIDQHAAHESILYAQFFESFVQKKHSPTIHKFEVPLIIELPINDRDFIFANLDKLANFGFEIEQFGNDSVKVFAVPELFKTHDILPLINEIISSKEPDLYSQKTIAFLACRSAIKAGDVLNHDEQIRLLEKLDNCPDLYTCPHGRPLKIYITPSELARMFKRVK